MPIPGSPVTNRMPPDPASAASTTSPARGELALAPDERRLHGGQTAGAARRRSHTFDAIGEDGLVLAFEVESSRFAPVEDGAIRRYVSSPDEHRPRFRPGLEPGGRVHGVAEGRILDATPGAESPHDHRAAVDPDTNVEARDPEGPLDLPRVGRDLRGRLERRPHRPLRVVLVGRGAPKRASTPSPARSLTVPP